MINRKDIIPFTCNNDLAKSSPMQSHSELLRDISRVQGERKLRDIHPLTMKLSFELCQHENEYIGFFRMITTLLRTKQQM
jgi:hypothetical protein